MPGFLKLLLFGKSVCVRICVHPQAIINHSHKMKTANQTNPIAFQFLYMTLVIDITDGRGLSNGMHDVLLSN